MAIPFMSSLNACTYLKSKKTTSKMSQNHNRIKVTTHQKIIGRLELFNCYEWVKKQSKIIVDNWTFHYILKIGNCGYLATDNYNCKSRN